jgi:osmoprotectant transport system permease protein
MMPVRCLGFVLLALAFGTCARPASASERVVVGSKAFPESWILAEAAALLAQSAGASTSHAMALGGTEIAYGALETGQIDLYPEYTGTIDRVILRGFAHRGEAGADARALASAGVSMSAPLGFDDGYALATSARGASAGLHAISDLAGRPDLRLGFTHEFLGRADGYQGLAARYELSGGDVRGLQHELALLALSTGDLDVTDVYTTDPQIDRLGLRVLDDDRKFFPRYDAVFLYASDLPERAPRAFAAIMRLAGRIGEAQMRRANDRVALEHEGVGVAARALLRDALGVELPAAAARSIPREIASATLRHLELVGGSVLAAVLFGVPLGILATRSRVLAFVATSFSSVLQTVPSLALLALLVPVLGIGAKPALVALFLYGLLPIIRATYTGLVTISPSILESAEAIGLSWSARLLHVLLPIASPHVLSGIRVSTALAVGTATLAALVGAGGLGQPILQGINLQDTTLVLEGALPAALLALAADGMLAVVSRYAIPRGLRLERSSPG